MNAGKVGCPRSDHSVCLDDNRLMLLFSLCNIIISVYIYISLNANGNTCIEIFGNNTDEGESARDELSNMKLALFAFFFIANKSITLTIWKINEVVRF